MVFKTSLEVEHLHYIEIAFSCKEYALPRSMSNYVHSFYGNSIWIWPCEVIASVAAVVVMVVKVHLWL